MRNVNLGRVENPQELVNLFQNVNELDHVSVSLNKGILGKLELMAGWEKLKNVNILVKTIVAQNLEQSLKGFEGRIAKTVGEAEEVQNLVILALALSKFHKPPMTLVAKILERVKVLTRIGQSEKA